MELCLCFGFFLGQRFKALVQIDLVGDGNDGIAEHDLLIGGIYSDIVNGIFQAEDIGQQILEFIHQIVIGPFRGIGPLLETDEVVEVIKPEKEEDGEKLKIKKLFSL